MKQAKPEALHVVADQSEVFGFLSDPHTYGADGPVERFDTHGAAVFLAGDAAYKVKRAVSFPFMDYSTLEKRRNACEAELAVNRPHAPGLYLGLVSIVRRSGSLAFGGPGEPVEWAVHMRRFPQGDMLDAVASTHGLSPDLIVSLTHTVLASHERAPRRDGIAALASLARYLRENDEAFRESPDLFPAERADRLSRTAQAALASVRELLIARGEAGHVRRCHGDLHLRNIVLLDGVPTLFDAVEFDEAIATGDVLYDLAFLLMDLWERDLRWAANVIMNRYLAASGGEDHLTGLAALPLFLSIRAAIRAKVTAASVPHLSGTGRDEAVATAVRYFRFAEAFLESTTVSLVAVGGLSGTGKTTLAAALAPDLGRPPGAVHVRSDVERKQLFGIPETQRLPATAYAPEVSREVYRRVNRKTALALAAGQSVIADAVYAAPEERQAIAQVASATGSKFRGLWLEAPLAVAKERVKRRQKDASDADEAVVERQADYDCGRIDWARLEVSGPLKAVVAAARRILDGVAPPGEPSSVTGLAGKLTSMPDALAALLARIVIAGGGPVAHFYRSGCETHWKPDRSPVTEADTAAEAIILEWLARELPGVPVLSEEQSSQATRDLGSTFILVDPLDGTKEFLARNGEFTISAAVVTDGRPVAGAIYAPARETVWFGGDRAFKAHAAPGQPDTLGDRRAVCVRPAPKEGLTVLVSRSHANARVEEFLATLSVTERRAVGSALKFCLIAEGQADLYPRFGTTMEWDTAPGHAILLAAGGSVETVGRAPLLYGKREMGFRNPGFVARGKARAHS
jgi:uncharacterized protein